MPERYDKRVREDARRLWLRGGLTDAEIATRASVQRADTIRDWRREDDWEAFKREIDPIVEAQIKARQLKRVDALDAKHDQLGEALESIAVRIMRARQPNGEPEMSAADVRSLAGALAAIQKIRRIAVGADNPIKTVAEVPIYRIIYKKRDDGELPTKAEADGLDGEDDE